MGFHERSWQRHGSVMGFRGAVTGFHITEFHGMTLNRKYPTAVQ